MNNRPVFWIVMLDYEQLEQIQQLVHIRPWAPLKKWPSHNTHGGFAPEQTKLSDCVKTVGFCRRKQLFDGGRIKQIIIFCQNCFRARTWSLFSAWLWFTTNHWILKKKVIFSEYHSLQCYHFGNRDFFYFYQTFFFPWDRERPFCRTKWYSECSHHLNVIQLCWSLVCHLNSIWCDVWLSIDISPAISLRADYCKKQQPVYIFWAPTNCLKCEKPPRCRSRCNAYTGDKTR